MATKYYRNAHGYFVEAPLTYGGSLSVAPGKYVVGSGDTGASFPRLVTLGILTDAGATADTGVGSAWDLIRLTPSLLIFSEPTVPLTGPTGDTGVAGTAVAKGDTGSGGAAGAVGGTGAGTVGGTGTAGAVGGTGVAGVAGDTGTAGAQGDTGAAGS